MAKKQVHEVYLPKTLELDENDKSKFIADVQGITSSIPTMSQTNESKRGVVYLGHIPTGFYEPQMKKFFSQFGRVTRLRLSRSKKIMDSTPGWIKVSFLKKSGPYYTFPSVWDVSWVEVQNADREDAPRVDGRGHHYFD